jgi:hypothetical protein
MWARSTSVKVTWRNRSVLAPTDAEHPAARGVGPDCFHPHRLAELRPGQVFPSSGNMAAPRGDP